MIKPLPYRSTPVFTNDTLPDALRRAHSTKAGVWGLLKVLKGAILYVIEETGQRQVVHAPHSVVILPRQRHYVDPRGDMEVQVDFYLESPLHRPSGRSRPPG